MSIVTLPLPSQIADGQLADAVPVMGNMNYIAQQVNANAAPATTGGSILYANGTGGFSPVTVGVGLAFAGGALTATASGGNVTGSSLTSGNIILGAGTTNIAASKVAVTQPATAGTLVFGVDNATLTFQGTDTILGRATTDTLTNKRITARTGSVASSATPTINTDNMDLFDITALAAAITSMTTNLSGTPVNGDGLIITFTDNGTGRAITWGASFEASTVALPSTTVASTKLTVALLWDVSTSKWRCVGVA